MAGAAVFFTQTRFTNPELLSGFGANSARAAGSFGVGALATHLVAGKVAFWLLFGEDSGPDDREKENFDLPCREKAPLGGSCSAVDVEGGGTGFPNSVVGGFTPATFGSEALATKFVIDPPGGASGCFLNRAKP